MRVERVAEKAGALEDVRVVRADVGEALADRPQPRGLGRRVELLGEIGAVDDERQLRERRILRKPFGDVLEGAAPGMVLVRAPGASKPRAPSRSWNAATSAGSTNVIVPEGSRNRRISQPVAVRLT